ncbi:MAG: AEC family transporter, partial [Clostridia bacterium]|nr:AEC family transporter [Clostridia bacterium]
MEAFLFALNAVAPIMLMAVIGYILNRVGLIKDEFTPALNRLVFKAFLPAMLFLNVYSISDFGAVDFSYIIYVLLVIFAVFLISIPLVIIVTKNNSRRGALLQATFRSNFALIGIPVGGALFGAEGAVVATLLSAAIIPVYNILGVISLSLFSEGGKKPSVKKILIDIIKNPLIESIALGFVCLAIRALFLHFDIAFRLEQIIPLM